MSHERRAVYGLIAALFTSDLECHTCTGRGRAICIKNDHRLARVTNKYLCGRWSTVTEKEARYKCGDSFDVAASSTSVIVQGNVRSIFASPFLSIVFQISHCRVAD